MDKYKSYQNQIAERASEGLHPLPIDGAELVTELIAQIKDKDHEHREESLNFFIYNV